MKTIQAKELFISIKGKKKFITFAKKCVKEWLNLDFNPMYICHLYDEYTGNRFVKVHKIIEYSSFNTIECFKAIKKEFPELYTVFKRYGLNNKNKIWILPDNKTRYEVLKATGELVNELGKKQIEYLKLKHNIQ